MSGWRRQTVLLIQEPEPGWLPVQKQAEARGLRKHLPRRQVKKLKQIKIKYTSGKYRMLMNIKTGWHLKQP